ncbi:hypothetical protein [Paraburkholderia bannensis]|uniref:hypothetical protein n=1 Tax=Paraburkholderia bannensis TaxID=765414 RepID=UPI002AB6B1AA|nr:hypothetical protein [Paraburkholderia bannensis]
MQKSDLINLLEANDRKYPVFLKKAKECTVSEKWGSGMGAPFSLEPYRMEMLGIKPGRMLKGKSEPGARRYHYMYDREGRVVHVVAYGKLGGDSDNKDWMKSDEFYEYSENFAFRFVFDNTFRENPESQLTRVVCIEYQTGQVKCAYQLEKRNLEYTESVYSYDDRSEAIVGITVKWPSGPYPNRVLRVDQGDGHGDIKILEVRDQKETSVYPER